MDKARRTPVESLRVRNRRYGQLARNYVRLKGAEIVPTPWSLDTGMDAFLLFTSIPTATAWKMPMRSVRRLRRLDALDDHFADLRPTQSARPSNCADWGGRAAAPRGGKSNRRAYAGRVYSDRSPLSFTDVRCNHTPAAKFFKGRQTHEHFQPAGERQLMVRKPMGSKGKRTLCRDSARYCLVLSVIHDGARRRAGSQLQAQPRHGDPIAV